jgi:Zn-dependent protease
MFGVLGAMLAFGYLPQLSPAAPVPERIAVGLILAAVLFASLLAHEVAHAVVARRRGLPVGSLTMYLFGANNAIDDLHSTAADEIAVGLSGPAVSAAIAAVFLAAGLGVLRINEQAGVLLADIGVANGLLAAFNLLPGYPMDGGRVLRGILWKAGANAISSTRRAALCGRIVAYLTIAGGVALVALGDTLNGIWVIAAGWFLISFSQAFYRRFLTRIALDGLKAKDFCTPLPVLQTDATIASAAQHFGAGAASRVLAVAFGERAAGVVLDVDIAQVDSEHADTTPVSAVMRRTVDVAQVEVETPALETYAAVGTGPAQAAIVVDDDGCYYGLVRNEDIARYIDMIEDLGNSAAASGRNWRALVKPAPLVPVSRTAMPPGEKP